jgi:hypothetical protein
MIKAALLFGGIGTFAVEAPHVFAWSVGIGLALFLVGGAIGAVTNS